MQHNFKSLFEPQLIAEFEEIPEIELDKDFVLLKENTYIKEIPLLIEGSIKVRKTDETGKEIILYRIEEGESCILSITSYLNEKQSRAEAITEQKSRMLVIPAYKVREWMDNYRSWRKFVLQLYYSRLEELLTLVDSISFKQIDMRVIDKLKELQIKHGSIIPITHQKLATEIGTAREVVSRLLKQLENNHLITLERGIIKILRPL